MRHRERQRETERGIEKDRDRQRQTETERGIEKDRERQRDIERQTKRDIETETPNSRYLFLKKLSSVRERLTPLICLRFLVLALGTHSRNWGSRLFKT